MAKFTLARPFSFKNRMAQHKHSKKIKKTYLSRAIKKYGWDNFEQEILIDDVPEEDLNP